VFKKITILSLIVVSSFLSKAQLNDDFNDGDFSVSPVWTPGIPTDFKDTLAMLRSNNLVASSSSYISTPNTLANNCQWEFFVNLKFATSSANYVDIYLTADNANLSSGTLNGYFVRIGNTTDEISLYRNVSGTITEILDGIDAVVSSSSNNLIKIKVVRDASNQFTLNRDMTGTGSSYVSEGVITDATFTTSAFFGFFIQQSTASFFKKHFFDDVYVGPIITDTAPPTLVSATPLTATTLDVLFSEPLDITTAQTLINYTVDNSIGNPSVAVLDGGNPALMHLTFAGSFVNLVNYEIVVNNVADVALNAINNDTLTFAYFVSDTAIARDVVINEIMADETPQVGLPAAEFIELYNNSTKNLDLAGWTISDGSSTATLSTLILTPGQYVILCATTQVVNFTSYGTTLGVTSIPSLNNAGDPLTLKNNLGTTIDYVNYSDTWYNDGTKDDGGWTLEQINPNAGCLNASNWSASNDVAGGTPGAVNSIYNTTPDVTPPTIVSSNLNNAYIFGRCRYFGHSRICFYR
jgi:Lamin Tail Domain